MKPKGRYSLRSSLRGKKKRESDESVRSKEAVISESDVDDHTHEVKEKQKTTMECNGDVEDNADYVQQSILSTEGEEETEVKNSAGTEESRESDTGQSQDQEDCDEFDITVGPISESHANKPTENDFQKLDLHSLTKKILSGISFKVSASDLPGRKKKSKKGKEAEPVHDVDLLLVPREESTSIATTSSKLTSELHAELDDKDLYMVIDRKLSKPVEITDKGNRADEQLMKKSVLGANLEKLESAPLVFKSKVDLRKERRKQREETAGPGWYNLPKTELTDSVKRDLQMIRMRNIIDPHRHYKKDSSKEFPKYFQIGTVVEGSADFYSSRLTKKERKQTIVDQLLSDAEFRRRNKRKYVELQKQRGSGGKLHFKKMKNKRKPVSLRT